MVNFPKKHYFWDSEEGKRYKDRQRSTLSLQMMVDFKVRTKRSKSHTENGNLRELMLTRSLPWRSLNGKFGTRWPRRRAHIALDLHFTSSVNTPPRVDNICKWLLDELGNQSAEPIVYSDDRQVKLLFAMLYPHREKEIAKNTIYVKAQTLTEIFRGIRRATSVEPVWQPQRQNRDLYSDSDTPFNISTTLDSGYESDNSEFTQEWNLRARHEKRFKHQRHFLSIADYYAARILIDYAIEHFDKVNSHEETQIGLMNLSKQPYAFNLGRLPIRPGETILFKDRVKTTLTEYVKSNPKLFPIYSAVGLTLFYIENSAGKDLDNILHTVVPIMLECLEPPDHDLSYWSSVEEIKEWLEIDYKQESKQFATRVQFLEAIALKLPNESKIAPGTVIMTLSSGRRLESWWESAQSHLDDLEQHGYDQFDDPYD